MKLLVGLLISVPIWCGCGRGTEEAASRVPPLTVAALNERPVIGLLGVPLGQAVEVEATIIAGRSLQSKADASDYLLRIDAVDGKRVEKPVTLHFNVPSFVDAKLANDDFDLYKMKKGKRAGSLDASMIAEVEKGYVGSTVKLVVYESGSFSGIPKGLPQDAPIWQDTGFGFSTYLVVLKQRP